MVKYDASLKGLTREQAHERRNGRMNKISEPLGFSRYFCCLLSCFGISNQLDMLRIIVPTATQAKRNGRMIQIDPVSLVVGDIVQMSTGDFVPADLRIIDASDCLFNTHQLTRKAELLEADPHIGCSSLTDSPNVALVGYQCTGGSCLGLVVATGSDCHLSKLVLRNQFPVQSDSKPALALEFVRV